MGMLKCGFYYYSGLVRPTDQEMTVMEKIFCDLQFPRGEGMPCSARPHGEAPGLARRQRQWGQKQKQVPLSWFPWERTGETG